MDDSKRKSRQSRFIKGTTVEKPPNQDGVGMWAILWHPMSTMLVCFPLAMLAHHLEWGELSIFWLNFTALVPLAKILGDITEELAAGLKNDMLAGLLNATFGNAVEVVIMVQTLRAGLIDVVKATLLGSVLSNLLLVLGCSFFFGGIISKRTVRTTEAPRSNMSCRGQKTVMGNRGMKMLAAGSEGNVNGKKEIMEMAGEKVQHYSVLSAMVNTSMLLLACLSLSLVTVFHNEAPDKEAHEAMHSVLLPVSRICSIIIMVAYVAYVFFQLVTHREAMADCEEADDDEAEEPTLTIQTAVGSMMLVTVCIAYASEMLIGSLEVVVEQTSLGSHFIGIILLPIVGNACEHASAIRFAIQDKPGLAIGIAVGSSTQISMFVVPFAVLMGWWLGQPMDLNFGSLNTTVVDISVVVVLSVVVDGSANWLQGYLLISAYFVISILYWHLPDKVN